MRKTYGKTILIFMDYNHPFFPTLHCHEISSTPSTSARPTRVLVSHRCLPLRRTLRSSSGGGTFWFAAKSEAFSGDLLNNTDGGSLLYKYFLIDIICLLSMYVLYIYIIIYIYIYIYIIYILYYTYIYIYIYYIIYIVYILYVCVVPISSLD